MEPDDDVWTGPAARIDAACAEASATSGRGNGAFPIRRIGTADADGVHVVAIGTERRTLLLSLRPETVRTRSARGLAVLFLQRAEEGTPLASRLNQGLERCRARLESTIQRASADLALETLQMAPHPAERALTAQDLGSRRRSSVWTKSSSLLRSSSPTQRRAASSRCCAP